MSNLLKQFFYKAYLTTAIYFQMAYVFLSIMIGISIIGATSLSVVVSAIFAPIMAWWGGAGLKGSLFFKPKDKIFGIAIGAVHLLIAVLWVYITKFKVIFFGTTLSGALWVTFGFIIGFIFTQKKDTEGAKSIED